MTLELNPRQVSLQMNSQKTILSRLNRLIISFQQLRSSYRLVQVNLMNALSNKTDKLPTKQSKLSSKNSVRVKPNSKLPPEKIEAPASMRVSLKN